MTKYFTTSPDDDLLAFIAWATDLLAAQPCSQWHYGV